jgi:hypothetical protein
MQRRGIGTNILHKLIADSKRCSKEVTLAVMNVNPAGHLIKEANNDVPA